MIIIGIDQSLTNFAYTVLDNSGVSETGIFKSKMRGVERLFDIKGFLVSLLNKHNPDIVGIEGYAYGRIFRAHDMGELAGMLKMTLKENNIEYLIVSPTHLKKFVTGKGNASKELMIESVNTKWGFETSNDNIADSFSIAKFVEIGETR